MFDEFNITLQDITAQETQYDWYQDQLCEHGRFTYMSTTAECYDCGESGVN